MEEGNRRKRQKTISMYTYIHTCIHEVGYTLCRYMNKG